MSCSFFFDDTATTDIYTYCHTLSLHAALPIFRRCGRFSVRRAGFPARCRAGSHPVRRSEEHTSELQSLMRTSYAVFCLKKKRNRSATFRNQRCFTIHVIHQKTHTTQILPSPIRLMSTHDN